MEGEGTAEQRRLTRVCCDLDRDSRISSTIRSDRDEAMLSFTSLHYEERIKHKINLKQIDQISKKLKGGVPQGSVLGHLLFWDIGFK